MHRESARGHCGRSKLRLVRRVGNSEVVFHIEFYAACKAARRLI
jgi:hypothetical protein